MIIETLTYSEAEAVFAREKAGEFKITGMKVGKTNASWVFTVSEPPSQRDLPELDAPAASFAARSRQPLIIAKRKDSFPVKAPGGPAKERSVRLSAPKIQLSTLRLNP
jgi:hypothetical protein